MRDYYTLRINLPAGIVSPGTLRTVLTLAAEAEIPTVRFGARQQLLLTVHYERLRALERSLREGGIAHEVHTEQYPNIISSYCGEAVFRTGAWLAESEYRTVLDSFEYRPRLKVNLSEANQSFSPFFTGNLNFITSPEPHFWYLYVRPRQQNQLYRWRDLVYSNDVGRLARAVEDALLADSHPDGSPPDEEAVYGAVAQAGRFITQPATQDVDLPDFALPYYEGMNRYGARLWLGLYRRDEQFSVPFLLDVCTLCLRTRIGELCVTPYKSLIIKGIAEKDQPAWSQVLGRHNINVRHAANELPWQTEDHSDEGLRLKRRVIRYFNRHDTRTFGLCFGVQTRPKSEVFGSVLIRKRPLLRVGSLALLSVYDIYHTEQFNPNSRVYVPFERGLLMGHVPGQLDRLCRRFSRQHVASATEPARLRPDEPETPPTPAPTTYACPDCLTVYDPAFGDARRYIAPGLPFADLPTDYACPTCDTPKTRFRRLTPEEPVVAPAT